MPQETTEPLTPEHFLPHVEKSFRIGATGHSLMLSQVEVGDANWQTRGAARQPFTLIFRGAPDPLLPEGMYTVEIEGGASFELYLIPVQTPVRDRQDYQAAFN